MTNAVGIPSTRISDMFAHQRVLQQVQFDQAELFRLQNQLSTGRQFELPSDDAVASLRVMRLQALLERKAQVQRNLETNQSYLTTTDVAMSGISGTVAEARGLALSVIGTIATDEQRATAALQVEQTIEQLINAGNQQFRGRYLFAGSTTTATPFDVVENNLVKYFGNEGLLKNYSDVDMLFDTNLTGVAAFGAISETVQGAVDLNPVLTYNTRLADLRLGQGISDGSIAISDGSSTSIVDVSTAETIGDVAALIRDNPPQGTTLDVQITATGLAIQIDQGNLSIREVGGGITANALGILTPTGVGTAAIVGRDLDPILRKTTQLADILGTRANAVVRFDGSDNDIIIEADTRGETDSLGRALNDVAITLVDDNAVDAGNEFLVYDAAARTIEIHIEEGRTKAWQVVAAVNDANQAGSLPFTARLDPLDEERGGLAAVSAAGVATTAGGAGIEFDQQSGIQIVNGGNTYTIDFTAAETVEDLLNTLNGSEAGLLAEINQTKTGIDVRSRLSGCNFAIGENGGLTATQLGLRTFTEETRLEDLNFGRGVDDYEGTGTMAEVTLRSGQMNNDLVFRARRQGPDWNDYTIQFVDTAATGAETITYDQANKTITVGIASGYTTANDVIDLFAATPGPREDFELHLEWEDGSPNLGTGLVSPGVATTSGGALAGNDFTITRADDVTLEVNINGIVTIDQLIDRINNTQGNEDGLLVARLSEHGNGIELVDDSNGPGDLIVTRAKLSTAAIDLGLIPEGEESHLSAVPGTLAGVTVTSAAANSALIFRSRGTGTQPNGVQVIFKDTNPDPLANSCSYDAALGTLTFEIEEGVTTANDVISLLNGTPTALAALSAALDPTGGNDGSGAVDLNDTVRMESASTDSNLLFQWDGPIPENGVRVAFQDIVAGESCVYDATTSTLTFDIEPGLTTAADIVILFNLNPDVPDEFTISLDPNDGNNGLGTVDLNDVTILPTALSGGEPATLTGTDPNPLETEGLFTALLRLQTGLDANDQWTIQRAVEMLDEQVVNFNFSRAELGARQQGLDGLQTRLSEENIELRSALSMEFDVDIVEVISNLTSRQLALEAGLKATSQLFQLTLMNYL